MFETKTIEQTIDMTEKIDKKISFKPQKQMDTRHENKPYKTLNKNNKFEKKFTPKKAYNQSFKQKKNMKEKLTSQQKETYKKRGKML